MAMAPPPAAMLAMAPMEWPNGQVRLKSAVFRAGCSEMSFLTASGVASWSCARGLAHSSVGQLSGATATKPLLTTVDRIVMQPVVTSAKDPPTPVPWAKVSTGNFSSADFGVGQKMAAE